MEVLVALQIALKVTLRETFLLNFGMCQDTSDTKTVGPFFIPKSMVRGEPSCLCSFEKQLEPDYLFKAMQFVYYLVNYGTHANN